MISNFSPAFPVVSHWLGTPNYSIFVENYFRFTGTADTDNFYRKQCNQAGEIPIK